MITATSLKEYTREELIKLAKRHGVAGWHAMRKDQLVRAVARAVARSRAKPRASAAPQRKAAVPQKAAPRRVPKQSPRSIVLARRTSAAKAAATRPAPVRVRKKSPQVLQRIGEAHAERERQKDLATNGHVAVPAPRAQTGGGNGIKRNGALRRDRLVLMVRDPYWLHACWEITRQSVERVRVAMAEAWHTARPVLRLLEVESGVTTNTAERVLREIPIHGGVNNWYIDVEHPPQSFRVAIGYAGTHGKFHTLARSNSVTTPRPGGSEAVDRNWSEVARDCERIYAMSGGYSDDAVGGDLKELFEERLRRPMGSPLGTRFGAGAEGVLPRSSGFYFDVDAELVIYGQTRGDAHVTVAGQPVKVRPDGTFSVRQAMPDRRQVLPVVAGSRDGLEQRTVILAIERNTKIMEPVTRELSE